MYDAATAVLAQSNGQDGEEQMKRHEGDFTADDKEALLDLVEDLDQESRCLLALMVFSVSRRDPRLCEALDEIRRNAGGKEGAVERAGDNLLQRLRRVCPEDESKAWERALSFADCHGNGVMYQRLVELIRRRVAS